jgi:hypothetical protein
MHSSNNQRFEGFARWAFSIFSMSSVDGSNVFHLEALVVSSAQSVGRK